jgi:hypothetical protein
VIDLSGTHPTVSLPTDREAGHQGDSLRPDDHDRASGMVDITRKEPG